MWPSDKDLVLRFAAVRLVPLFLGLAAFLNLPALLSGKVSFRNFWPLSMYQWVTLLISAVVCAVAVS